MDYTEWIALTIVGLALFFYLRKFFVSKKKSCCGKTCPVAGNSDFKTVKTA